MSLKAQHILILFHDFSFGGTEVIALRLAARWAREGRRVTILCGTLDGPLWSAVPLEVHVVALQPEIGRSAFSRLRLRRALPAAIERLRPDVLFLPGNFHLVLAGAVRRLKHRPKVVAKISNPPAPAGKGPLRRLIENAWAWCARDADWLVAMSSGLAADVRQLTHADTVSVIHDPNIAGPLVPSQTAPIHALDRLHMVAAGRLVAQKDFALAIRVTAELSKSRDVRLTIYGEGPERGALERLIRHLGAQQYVTLAGHSTSIDTALRDADLMLVTSSYEGGPAVAVEALAQGVPVIATACSHFLADLLVDPDCGAVIDTRHADRFAAALDDWTMRPGRRAFSPESVTRPYASGPSARSYLDLFDRLVEGGEGGRARKETRRRGEKDGVCCAF
ncbi:MAG: glycosyltransferase [Sphingomonadales bacterium]|nr:glycosyltransferase [Sphingomonadales bacterium]